MRVPQPFRPRSLAAGVTLLAACNPRAGTRDPDVVLVIDGIEVRRQEWDDLLPFARSLEPKRGERSLRHFLLTDVVLRQALARRWHGDKLAAATKDAKVLSDLGKKEGAPALLRYGATEEKPLMLHEMPFPVARAAWALAEGQVSDPIVLPHGVMVIGVLDKEAAASSELDRVTVCARTFVAEPAPDLHGRLVAAVIAMKGRITWLDPDWRDSVPNFLLPDQ
jgi:hypothetical protein